MGGKGGGPSVDQNAINQQFYQAGAQGQKWNDIQGYMPSGGNYDMGLQSWMQGRQSGAGAHMPHFAGFEFPEMHMPHAPGGPSYEQQMADQEALYAQQQADAERIAGENSRDQLYSSYMDAAGSATDFVNAEIDREMSNAKLLGIDYTMNDELKNTRISDYFASVWGEGEQQSLEALIGKWGNPAGFSGYSVSRGDASKYAGTEGSEKTVGTSKGQKPKPTLATDEEEQGLGGGTTILGA